MRSLATVTPNADGWQWPDDLDAVVAAPAHHALVFENDRVRVLDARVEAGDTVPLHTHAWPSAQYFTSVADFVRRDAGGAVVVDSRTIDFPRDVPLALWAEAVGPHTLENVGTGPIHAVVVELKTPLPGRTASTSPATSSSGRIRRGSRSASSTGAEASAT